MSVRLYVGNLPFGIGDFDLEELFAQAGQVTSANIVTDRETGRSRGFGFVEMDSQEAAEAAIQQGLAVLMQGRTTIAVAHRLSTIREANRIVVLDKGSIAEIGSHDELLEKGGIYANLYRMTYQQEAAAKEAEMVGEDIAFARRRQGELAGAPAAGAQ